MKDILDTIAKHYKSHVVEANPIGNDEAEIIIRINVKGIEPSNIDNIIKMIDIFIQGLGKGKLVIPVTKKAKKKLEEDIRRIEKDRKLAQKAFLVARGIHVEGMENE